MDWSFDGRSPIWEQIVDNLREDIVSGKLQPGTRLAAVRELAMEAGVNPNTMQRALSELERLGLVYAVRTSGRFVTGDVEVISGERERLVRERAGEFLRSMEKLGYSKGEILKVLEDRKEEN